MFRRKPLSYIDKASYPILKAELCQVVQDGTPADVLGWDDATLEYALVDSALPSLFSDSFWESAEMIGGKKIADNTYAVVLKKPGKSNEGTVLIVRSQGKDSHTVDLAGLPTILGGINQGEDDRNIAEYITDSANELIGNPTKESCSTAIAWLTSSDGLGKKYGLLTSNEYRNYVSSTGIKMKEKSIWEKAENLAINFPQLLFEAETEMDNFRTADDYRAGREKLDRG